MVFLYIKTKKGKLIMTKKRKLFTGMAIFMLLMMTFAVTVFAGGETEAPKPQMYATFWSLVPPVVAIVLALITKEVYSSLF
ncbi:MAG: Na+/H+ antiporter NhaC family protein, partial [Blautia sp.]|nr:Na+/H+ antiporter NhaC family protein [Blautia sp.]